jgi:hypothetical protein
MTARFARLRDFGQGGLNAVKKFAELEGLGAHGKSAETRK